MRIAITGGAGFVGGHLARELVRAGHEVVLIVRPRRSADARQAERLHTHACPIGLDDENQLAGALSGCDAIAHCAGINRQIGRQTYRRVHVEGTRHVVRAARRAGVKKIILLSFLRARPDCGSGYHESKWAAEEIVRQSGLDYTVLKAGVIYGRGDHMLDHLSHALHTFPVFGLTGFKEPRLRPTAVSDITRMMRAALAEGRLSRQTVAVVGPEEITLAEAVRRVARVIGKRPLLLRMPIAIHYGLAWCWERLMKVPLVSIAQVRILSEGIVEPLPVADPPPPDLRPNRRFTEQSIREGLPELRPFSLRDCRCCAW